MATFDKNKFQLPPDGFKDQLWDETESLNYIEISKQWLENVKNNEKNAIYLCEVEVAGTTYISDIEFIARNIKKGDYIKLKLEDQNEYDENAIALFSTLGRKIGYVKKEKNEVLSNLMRYGKELFAKLIFKEEVNHWNRFIVEIYMFD
ncbi:MAG: HIRAN domain-containing protein [Tissierellia bacterium]|nr:HIRAN domain-containing protein [Tissierellia bacterium]